MGSPKTAAAAPRIELPSLIAATMRSRKSPDSGAGMTSPPTHQNRLPRISIPDSAQHKSALADRTPDIAARKQVIVVVCKTDRRSARAAIELLAAGLQDVTVLRGGTDGWYQQGLTLE